MCWLEGNTKAYHNLFLNVCKVLVCLNPGRVLDSHKVKSPSSVMDTFIIYTYVKIVTCHG